MTITADLYAIMRKILHVDMDAFFAAVEQLRKPFLRGRPVVVGGDGNPHRRGVVSTASYEARAYGIHSAMPLRVAYRKCPKAIFLPVDFEAYGAYSKRIMTLLREYTALVEAFSMDEAFLDVSERPEPALEIAQTIHRRIHDEIGLTASIGVGANKLLAKLASGLRKPNAITEIQEGTAPEVLRPLPVTALWGVGPKTGARLEQALGVRTVGDLQQIGTADLQELLGDHHGASLARLCRGEDDSPVIADWEMKSVSRETTYQADTRQHDQVIRTLSALTDDVVASLRRDGSRGKTVTVKIRYHDFQTHTRALTLLTPTDELDTIRQTAIALLDRFTLDRPIRLVGIRISNLHRAADSPGDPSIDNALPTITDQHNPKMGT